MWEKGFVFCISAFVKCLCVFFNEVACFDMYIHHPGGGGELGMFVFWG